MRSLMHVLCLTFLCALPAAAATPDVRDDALLQVNHRVYREDRWGYGVNCRDLRRACMYKNELGEQGRGNCQRYRELCQ